MAQEEWTTEQPTEPGWYWQRFTGSLPAVLCVYSGSGGRMFVKWDSGGEPVDLMRNSEWAGPIYTPEQLGGWLRDEGVIQSNSR